MGIPLHRSIAMECKAEILFTLFEHVLLQLSHIEWAYAFHTNWLNARFSCTKIIQSNYTANKSKCDT